MQIHFLGLQGPFSAVAHSPKGPENDDKNVNHRDPRERDETILTERFFQITKAGRPDVHHFLAPAPEEQSSNDHRDARNSERPARSVFRISQKPRAKNRRNKRAGVDRKIKPTKHLRKQMTV